MVRKSQSLRPCRRLHLEEWALEEWDLTGFLVNGTSVATPIPSMSADFKACVSFEFIAPHDESRPANGTLIWKNTQADDGSIGKVVGAIVYAMRSQSTTPSMHRTIHTQG